MDKSLEQNENKTNRFQWFLVVVIIPLLFAITVTIIVMTIAGINVFETVNKYGQKLPFVSSYFADNDSQSLEKLESDIVDLEASIKDGEAKIEKLESQLGNKDEEIEKYKLEKEQLEMQISELMAIQEENKRAFKEIVQTYETISAKKAAPIVVNLKEEEALKILTNVKAETLASILENMSAKDAAKYTELLTANEGNE
ncbi:MotE family protein [Bacillus sp. CGMCC 1.16607]|uniref:MotE family protein n=1 Tax=Bacillus sp. CGMCC 1.16607 TaxID=3351842 RepID=UPI00363C5675